MASVDDFTEKYRLQAESWAELDGEANRLEELKKVIHSELVNQCEESSVAAREHWANAHPTYRKHVEAMVAARTTATIARARMKAMEVKWETWRSKNATRRAESKIL